MISISNNVYIDKSDDIAYKCNNTYHRTIKMKPFDVKSGTQIDFNKEKIKESPKFAVADHIRISKCKNIFAKDYVSNLSQEGFVNTKVKNTVP